MYYETAQGTKSTFARAISAEIRARLASYRISGKQLASDVGLSQNYIAKRLRDEAPFTIDDVDRIVAALPTDEGLIDFINAAYERQEEAIWTEMESEHRKMSEPASSVDGPDEYGLVASRHEVEDAPDSI